VRPRALWAPRGRLGRSLSLGHSEVFKGRGKEKSCLGDTRMIPKRGETRAINLVPYRADLKLHSRGKAWGTTNSVFIHK